MDLLRAQEEVGGFTNSQVYLEGKWLRNGDLGRFKR